MKKVFTTLLIGLLFFAAAAKEGDTIKVKTLTFDDIVQRKATYDFPAPGTKYQKVLMYKTLKCDSRTTRDKYPCGEWDYLTYIYVWDSTGTFDSTLIEQANFTVENKEKDQYSFTNTPTYNKYLSWKKNRVIDNIEAADFHSVGKDINTQAALHNNSGRTIFIYTASELSTAGVKPGEIDAMQLKTISALSGKSLFQVSIDSTTENTISPETVNVNPYLVYDYVTDFSTAGPVILNFKESYIWNGSSNLVFYIDYVTENAAENMLLLGEQSANDTLVWTSSNDKYLDFENVDYIDVPNNTFKNVDNEITISFWHFGDEVTQPKNNSIIEGYDIDGNRVLNIHMPWSNGSVYWDAGFDEGTYDRILYKANEEDYKGKWNFWAFTKNTTTGEMKIFLNDKRVMYATGKKKTMAGVVKFKIGSGNNTDFYDGAVDEFCIFNKELNLKTFNEWKQRNISTNHQFYSNLQLYYTFDNDNSTTVFDASPNANNGSLVGKPFAKEMRSTNYFKGFKPSDFKPQITLLQGNLSFSKDSTQVSYYDYIAPQNLLIYNNDKSPNKADSNLLVYEANIYTYTYSDSLKIDSQLVKPTRSLSKNSFNWYNVFEVVNRYEIGRFITPYGIGLDLGPDGFTWVYDVTDYVHLLSGRKTIQAGNTQELIDLQFHYIEGTPTRDVVKLEDIWENKSYLYKDLDNDDALSAKTIDLEPGTKTYKVITRLTGHGHNSNNGEFPHCCEWKDNTHSLLVNGKKVADWKIWRDDCDQNPVFPQGGTWNGEREGWCPGDIVPDFEFEITDFVKDNKATIDYSITPVPSDNQGMGSGNYRVGMQLVQYADANFNQDAEIYDVKRPSNKGIYSRINPACESPLIILKNSGKNKLTSVDFEYWVEGNNQKLTYTWTGSLALAEKTEVLLPVPNSHFWVGNGSNEFKVKITAANGGKDEYELNNQFTSYFDLPDILENKFTYYFKTNANPEANKIIIRKASGEVVYEKSNFSANTVYEDEINLANGCYVLELEDEGYGLSYWAAPSLGTGSFSLKNESGKVIKVFEPDFGQSIYYPFAIGTISNIKNLGITADDIKIYPNPSQGLISVNLALLSTENTVIEVFNSTGKRIVNKNLGAIQISNSQINLSDQAKGVYLIKVTTGQKTITKQIVIQ